MIKKIQDERVCSLLLLKAFFSSRNQTTSTKLPPFSIPPQLHHIIIPLLFHSPQICCPPVLRQEDGSSDSFPLFFSLSQPNSFFFLSKRCKISLVCRTISRFVPRRGTQKLISGQNNLHTLYTKAKKKHFKLTTSRAKNLLRKKKATNNSK